MLQADGKGVPLIPPPSDPSARRQAGRVRSGKKEAVVTCVYTIIPYQRTAQEVVAALLKEERADPPRIHIKLRRISIRTPSRRDPSFPSHAHGGQIAPFWGRANTRFG